MVQVFNNLMNALDGALAARWAAGCAAVEKAVSMAHASPTEHLKTLKTLMEHARIAKIPSL